MIGINPQDQASQDVYRLLTGGVAPRPIALVSTLSKNGTPNLAPFSFFNVFSSDPAVIGFSPVRRGKDASLKDTHINLVETKECVVHAVTYSMVHQINLASGEYGQEVNEFEKSGLTPEHSEIVKPYRVQESPFHMECKLLDMISLGEVRGSGSIALCEVVYFHVDPDVYHEGVIDPVAIDLVGRNGSDYYTRAFDASLFEVKRAQKEVGVGWDALPSWIYTMGFSKNQLAQLASIQTLPSWVSQVKQPRISQPGIEKVCNLLKQQNIIGAWDHLRQK